MVREHSFVRAKKKAKEIKKFYQTTLMVLVLIPVIILTNIKLIEPNFHWFWFPVVGLLYVLVTYWFSVFGFEKLGFGKIWKKKKIRELMDKDIN